MTAFRTKALIRRCVPGCLFRRRLHKTLLNPEWQQAIFVDEIEKLIGNRAGGTWLTVPGFHGPD